MSWFPACATERAAARILQTADPVDAERELRGRVRRREGGPTVIAALAAARAALPRPRRRTAGAGPVTASSSAGRTALRRAPLPRSTPSRRPCSP